MFNESFIQALKQNNVSADAEKTKQRTAELWKSADKDKRETVLSLAGVALSTIQRAYKTGSISAKLVVPLAQTLNVSPFYFTGQADEPGDYSDEQVLSFLQDKGYEKLLNEHHKTAVKEKRQYKRKIKVESAAPAINETEDEIAERFDVEMRESLLNAAEQYHAEQQEESTEPMPDPCSCLSPDEQAYIDSMTEDDMILLMRSVMLRSKVGGKNADTARKLKMLLLGIELE